MFWFISQPRNRATKDTEGKAERFSLSIPPIRDEGNFLTLRSADDVASRSGFLTHGDGVFSSRRGMANIRADDVIDLTDSAGRRPR